LESTNSGRNPCQPASMLPIVTRSPSICEALRSISSV